MRFFAHETDPLIRDVTRAIQDIGMGQFPPTPAIASHLETLVEDYVRASDAAAQRRGSPRTGIVIRELRRTIVAQARESELGTTTINATWFLRRSIEPPDTKHAYMLNGVRIELTNRQVVQHAAEEEQSHLERLRRGAVTNVNAEERLAKREAGWPGHLSYNDGITRAVQLNGYIRVEVRYDSGAIAIRSIDPDHPEYEHFAALVRTDPATVTVTRPLTNWEEHQANFCESDPIAILDYLDVEPGGDTWSV